MAEPRPYPTRISTQFSLATRRQHGRVVVEVEGELDLLSCGRIQETLLHLLDGGERDVVLDLARLRFCDEDGADTLRAGVARFERNHGQLRLSACPPAVADVLGELAVEPVVDVEPARRSA